MWMALVVVLEPSGDLDLLRIGALASYCSTMSPWLKTEVTDFVRVKPAQMLIVFMV